MPGKKENLNLSEMCFFELSVISVMDENVFKEIKKRMNQILALLEDGDSKSAMKILRQFLGAPRRK